MFVLVTIGFFVMVGCCFQALRTHHLRVALGCGVFVLAGYVAMMTVRPLTVGSGAFSFLALDAAVLLLGFKSVFLLFEAFDTPLPEDDDDGDGGGPAELSPDNDPLPGAAIAWSEFDDQRRQWERPAPVPSSTKGDA